MSNVQQTFFLAFMKLWLSFSLLWTFARLEILFFAFLNSPLWEILRIFPWRIVVEIQWAGYLFSDDSVNGPVISDHYIYPVNISSRRLSSDTLTITSLSYLVNSLSKSDRSRMLHDFSSSCLHSVHVGLSLT